MPLIEDKFLDNDCRFGLWEITEDFDTLFSQVQLVESDIQRLKGFKNDQRKLESLSVRALLGKMTYPGARIVYDSTRKPFMFDGSHRISISHSNKYTSILLSKERRIGIDLEYISHDIEKLSRHFINPREYITTDLNLRPLHYYVHWCAKEALYKICDKENIHFRKNLTILPFAPNPSGETVGVHHGPGIYETFILRYWVQNNYVIAYCLTNEDPK